MGRLVRDVEKLSGDLIRKEVRLSLLDKKSLSNIEIVIYKNIRCSPLQTQPQIYKIFMVKTVVDTRRNQCSTFEL